MPNHSKNVDDADRKVARDAIGELRDLSNLSTKSMELGVKILNHILGPNAYFCFEYTPGENYVIPSPSAALKVFIFRQVHGVWAVTMLSKGTSTAETFDGLGDGTLKDLDNEHGRRHGELKTYLEDVLRIQQVKDVSLYSCHRKAESGTLALTWAEWKARGWDWAIEKVNMDHIEAGNIWLPRSVAEGDVRPTTRGDIPWNNIWVARLKDVARGCSPSP